jgi:uncharacterized protein with von Willebrand factor type A (vWA) domain
MSGRFASLLDVLRRWFAPAPRTEPEITQPASQPAPPAFDAHALALDLFTRLHDSGFNIGVGELLALHRAVEGGWGNASPDELRRVARLIWCNSRQEQAEFDLQWQALAAASRLGAAAPRPEPPAPTPAPEREPMEPPTSYQPPESRAPLERHPELAALPVRAPFTPAPVTGEESIQSYWPLSRRAMVYAWRYLRRPVADGPADVLDVAATVAHTAQQGFYLAPVYRPRVRNHAHLLLLVDQGGSMAPFHRFTRDLVESAQQGSTLARVEVYYFHNVFAERVYRDPQRTDALPLDAALAECDAETSVLIVSDAGAARGRRDRARIRLTALALADLKSRTPLLAWLNPMPRTRWRGASAEIIAGLAPMHPMDADGLSAAIDQLRGQG